ncbi:MAG: hypothetical protein ACT4PL_14455 [Phycisphaerales bacterium]
MNKYGEFFPIGACIDLDGKLEAVAWSDGTEQPASSDVMDGLRSVFEQKAKQNSIRACGMCWDSRIRVEEGAEPIDVVCLEAESNDGEACKAYVPYTKSEDGTVELGEFEGFIADPQYFADKTSDDSDE